MKWYPLQLLALCACTTVTLGACSGPADLAGQIGPEDSESDTRVHPRPDMSTPAPDPSGLPKEIPLQVGQTVEIEGEFIPLATANAHDAGGSAAVIHYTHAPCGYATLGGVTYR